MGYATTPREEAQKACMTTAVRLPTAELGGVVEIQSDSLLASAVGAMIVLLV
jgi:hypothetical protein